MRLRSMLAALALGVAATLVVCGAAAAGPDSSPVSGLTTPGILSMISSTGDDSFSTMSLSPVDPSGTPTQHYGPYASGSPDSSTCGDDWANDTFDRDFTVRTEHDGTFTVVEQFKNGSFVTTGPNSPGACDETDGYGPGTIRPGVTGSMHGYFIVSGATVQTSSSPDCDAVSMPNADCDTTTFIDTHFGGCYSAGTCTVTTFFDHYSAGDQGLVVHEWKNASCDRGGNHGDIADMIGPPPPPTPCVE